MEQTITLGSKKAEQWKAVVVQLGSWHLHQPIQGQATRAGPGRAPSPVTTHALAYVHSYVAVLHVPFILQIQRYETVVLFTSLCILDF